MRKSIRIIITSLILVYVTNHSTAQVSGGITAGVSTSSVSISKIPDNFSKTIKGDNLIGFNAGVFAKLEIGPLYAKPQLLLEYKRGTVLVREADILTTEQTFSMEKLSIPVIFGFNIIGPLSIEAGPVYNYILGTSGSIMDNEDISIKRSGLGYRAGASAGFGRLNVFVHYQGIYNKASSSSDDATFESPNELIFGLGLGLGGDK